jgi:hypothetical protein
MTEGGMVPGGGDRYSGKGVGVTGIGVAVGTTVDVGTLVGVPVALGLGSLFLHALRTRLSKSTTVSKL